MAMKFRRLVLSALVAIAAFVAIEWIFAAASILQDFQLYPRDAEGGISLFLIEMVMAFFAAATAGIFCLGRLSGARQSPENNE